MNIFNALKDFALPNFSIFQYKGREIYEAIFESWGATTAPDCYMFSERLKTIASIVKAKALRYRYDALKGNNITFEELILELCPHNQDLAKETAHSLSKAIRVDKSIRDLRNRTNFDGKVVVSEDSIEEIVSGPIYNGMAYDELVSSAIDFQPEDLNEMFEYEILIDFEDPIYFDEDSSYIDVIDKDLEYLNKMTIYKGKTMDLLKQPNGGYLLCVDAKRRFHNGDIVCTDSARILRFTRNNLSIVIIE